MTENTELRDALAVFVDHWGLEAYDPPPVVVDFVRHLVARSHVGDSHQNANVGDDLLKRLDEAWDICDNDDMGVADAISDASKEILSLRLKLEELERVGQAAADAMHAELLKQVGELMSTDPEAGKIAHLAKLAANYEESRWQI